LATDVVESAEAGLRQIDSVVVYKLLSPAAGAEDPEYKAKSRGIKILRVGGRIRPHVEQIFISTKLSI
jgi:hypothetical protein